MSVIKEALSAACVAAGVMVLGGVLFLGAGATAYAAAVPGRLWRRGRAF